MVKNLTKRITIIAEAGVNHNGDILMAKELIEVAASAGADFVKFQTFSAQRQVTKNAAKAQYQLSTTGKSETQLEMLTRLELTDTMHRQLLRHCKKNKIKFLSTGFDIESIDYLVGIGQDTLKIPSGEISNLPYLRHIGTLDKKIILSTGMSNLDEIKEAIMILQKAGTRREKITILHCTTEYPAPLSEINLRAMQEIGSSLNVAIGYSDHTDGIEVSIAAAALGATVIEKHFTLNRMLPGPDHKASLEPPELKKLISAIRNIEVSLGDGVKRVTPSEVKNREIVRKSLVANKDILKGEFFTEDNVTAKRPGTGLSPMMWDEVMGKKALRNFNIEELIEL